MDCRGYGRPHEWWRLRELRAILEPLGYEVTGVPVKQEYLHLDMCFNLVDEHLAVSYSRGLPEDFRRMLAARDIEIIDVPEEAIYLHGCNLQACQITGYCH